MNGREEQLLLSTHTYIIRLAHYSWNVDDIASTNIPDTVCPNADSRAG